MTNPKRKKKISFTEGTGGDHSSALVGSAASASEEKEIEVLPETRVISDNTQCPFCKQWYSTNSSHSCK